MIGYLKIVTLAVIVYLFVPLRCETDVDDCALQSPCLNNGSCQNFNGTYNCSCSELFGGRHCEISVSITCGVT